MHKKIINHIQVSIKNIEILTLWQQDAIFCATQGDEGRLAGPPLLETSACGPRRLKTLDRLQRDWLPPAAPVGPECFFYATFEDQPLEASPCTYIWLPTWQIQKRPEGTTLWISFFKNSPPKPQEIEALLNRLQPQQLKPRALFNDLQAISSPDPLFEKSVIEAIKMLKPRQKVVLSRQLVIPGPQKLAIAETLLHLKTQHPQSDTFALSRPGGEVFLGATPERLLTLTPTQGGSLCTAQALGGSAALGAQEGARLAHSPKDQLEHRLIVEFFLKKLKQAGLEPKAPESPSLLKLNTLQHLQTFISAPAPLGTSVLNLAHKCFPSHAVCGSPTTKAKKSIQALEAQPRGLYTGLIGWQNVLGQGAALVPLRCATWTPGALRLYAGAGILKNSDPFLEKTETDCKLAALKG